MTVLYSGNFDPFTVGHLDIIEQASNLFDSVIVCVGRNRNKTPRFSSSKQIIEAVTEKLGNVKVYESNKQYPAEQANEFNCQYVLRGVRDLKDVLYENKVKQKDEELFPEIKHIYLTSKYPGVSSTMVYELYKKGYSIKEHLPYDAKLLSKLNLC